MADEINFMPEEPTVQPQVNSTGNSIEFTPDLAAEKEAKYGTLPQMALTGLEGAAKGALGPLATLGEKALGFKPEDTIARQETNPITHLAGEAAGFVAPAAIGLGEFSQAGVLGKAGTAVSESLGLTGAKSLAARLGVENSLYSLGDEISKEIQGNPDSIQTALAHVGLSGALGAAGGAALGKVSDLWSAKFGSQASQFAKDFQERLQARANGTLPTVENVSSELAQEYGATTAAMEDLRGTQGLKAQDIQKLLPEQINPKMIEQSNKLLTEVNDNILKAQKEKGIYQGARIAALEDYGNRLANVLADSQSLTPAKLYTAIDDFKKGLGSLKSWNVFSPEVEKPAAALMGKLYGTVKESLEDASVWGQAAKRQQSINKLFTEHIPASKDFERTFTEKVGGEAQVSPGKVNTLLNGLGKPNSEIKLDRLENYIKANDNLYKQLEEIHSNLGIENPFTRPNLTNTRSVLKNLTPGMKAADFLSTNAVNAASETLSGGAGATAAKLTGVLPGWMGYMFGHYALKPVLKTVMPSMIKPFLNKAASGVGMKSAIDTVNSVAKGDALISKAAKGLFLSSSKELSSLVPDKDKTTKLKEKLTAMQSNPEQMLSLGGHMANYLPDHHTALAATVQNAINLLEQAKPKDTQLGPLNNVIPPSKGSLAQYSRLLQIAEQPLSVLAFAKDGSLKVNEVNALKQLYPSLYPKIVDKVSKEMISYMSENKHVPFKLRKSLSMLMGQPMDHNFTPQSVMSIQATFMPQNSPQMAQGASKAKKGTAKLGKSAELAQTPAQARNEALSKA